MAQHVLTPMPSKKHHVLLWVLLALLIVVLAVAGIGGVASYRLYGQAKEVKAHEGQAMQVLQGTDTNTNGGAGLNSMDTLSQALPQAQAEAKKADSIAHGKLWNVAAKLPYVGGDITNVQGMTRSVDGLLSDSLPQFVTVFTGLKSANLSDGDQLNMQPIIASQQAMQTANQSFQKQVAAFSRLPEPRIGMVKTTYDTAHAKVSRLGEKVNQLANMLDALPQFLGAGQPRTYLIAAMTTSEARSSGGLIGSIGTMSADNGKIMVGEFRSNTEYESSGMGNPTQDEVDAFQKWGPMNMSFDIRDTGVYPETKRVAEGVNAIWHRTSWGGGQNIDAVILVDPVFLQELNKINGSVTLQSGQVLDGNNTAEFLLNTVYKEFSPEQQNVYFSDVADQSMGQMFSGMNMDRMISISQLMTSMAQGRHFNVYAFDTGMEQPLDAAGLTAHVPNNESKPTVGIYLNNQVGSKMEWYLKRTSTITQTNCNAQGAKTYHVEYRMKNTLDPSEVPNLPRYITGARNDIPLGTAQEKLLLYAPAEGSVSDIRYSGVSGSVTQRQLPMNGVQINASTFSVAPGTTTTLSFDVTTSPKATETPHIDQTPMGSVDAGVTVVASCKVK